MFNLGKKKEKKKQLLFHVMGGKCDELRGTSGDADWSL